VGVDAAHKALLTERSITVAPMVFDPAAPLNGCEATARYLGISRGLVYQQAGTGALPSVRIGSRLMIRTAALLELLGADRSADHEALLTERSTMRDHRTRQQIVDLAEAVDALEHAAEVAGKQARLVRAHLEERILAEYGTVLQD
jgi:hypothetical protein